MIDIKEMLVSRGLDTSKRIKLVRHLETRRFNIYEFHKIGLLELYQSYQSKPVFAQCDYIVSFIGMENSKARLIGVYQVKGVKAAKLVPLPPNIELQYPEMLSPDGFFYDLERLSGFEDLEERVVINWGKSAIAWHQWLSSKEIVEILPRGYVKNFPGYLDFVLSFDELATIIKYPDANREWHTMLRAVAGIYLIVDTITGKQYVGSAAGEQGILGRWIDYIKTFHGGNAQLQEILSNDLTYAKNFQFTILQTLPRTLTTSEVINYEALYKKKLGTKVFGLNSN